MGKIMIYTDGACSGNPGPGGWGAVIIIEDKTIELAETNFHHTTNNIMEMLSVVCSVEYVEQKIGWTNEELVIYTDSVYVYNCWKEQWWKKWTFNGWMNSKREPVKNKEIWEQLIPYFKKSNFSIVKVKGHASNYYNEMADKLATGAISPKH